MSNLSKLTRGSYNIYIYLYIGKYPLTPWTSVDFTHKMQPKTLICRSCLANFVPETNLQKLLTICRECLNKIEYIEDQTGNKSKK